MVPSIVSQWTNNSGAMDDRDVRLIAGAKSIARDLCGPAGAIPLDRVVAQHLPWFTACQERGMSWPQICRLLHAHGAGREGGLPFTHGHLSAVVWRQRQKTLSSLSANWATKAESNRSASQTVALSTPINSSGEDEAKTKLRAPKPRSPKLVRRAPAATSARTEEDLEPNTRIGSNASCGRDQPLLSEAEAVRIRTLMTRAAGRRR